MTAQDLLNFFQELHRIVPLPNDDKFKDTHSITLHQDGDQVKLQLNLWCVHPDGKIRCWLLWWDPTDDLMGSLKDLPQLLDKLKAVALPSKNEA